MVTTVISFDASKATVSTVREVMIRDGGLIIRNLLSQEHLEQIEKDVRPILEADDEWKGTFFPAESKRITGMVGKSPTAAREIIGNKLYQDICKEFLTDTISAYWGTEWKSSTSDPQLNNSIVFSIRPGARDQELHRDDIIHHNQLPATTPEEYNIGRDCSIGFFVAGKKATIQNGATRFIPGSHLWATEQPPDEALCEHAELDPGDAFMM